LVGVRAAFAISPSSLLQPYFIILPRVVSHQVIVTPWSAQGQSLFNDRLLILIIVNQIAAREIWQGRVRSPVRTIILWAAMRCTMMVEIVSLFKPDS